MDFKLVTLCSSNDGKMHTEMNLFVPDRQFSTRFKLRSKSAPFYSEFKPVTYSQLKENCTKIIKMKELPARNRTDSLVSPRLKKEIKSAVLLIENRSKNDVFKLENNHFTKEKLNNCNKCNVHNRNYLSKSAITAQNKTEKNTNRWKSAGENSQRLLHGSSLNATSAKSRFKISTLKNEKNEKTLQINNKISPVINEFPQVTGKRFISSISNSLTNFLTIDEVYGAKSEWENLQSGNRELTKEIPRAHSEIKIEKHEKKQPLSNQCKRESILRDYLNVYLNWRTSRSIQEHQDFVHGTVGHSRVRTAIPKSRLEMFHKVIDKQQTQLSEKKIKEWNFNKINIPKLKTREIIPPKIFNHHTKSTTPRQNENNNITNFQPFTDHENRTLSIMTDNESDSENDIEEYSEIDWLQCEDI